MTGMVERVARAIFRAHGPRGQSWEGKTEKSRGNYLKEASTSIAAMRDPTPEMLESAMNEEDGGDILFGDIWSAMIDEALRET